VTARTGRERVLLILGGLSLAAWIVHSCVWVPFRDRSLALDQRIVRAKVRIARQRRMDADRNKIEADYRRFFPGSIPMKKVGKDGVLKEVERLARETGVVLRDINAADGAAGSRDVARLSVDGGYFGFVRFFREVETHPMGLTITGLVLSRSGGETDRLSARLTVGVEGP